MTMISRRRVLAAGLGLLAAAIAGIGIDRSARLAQVGRRLPGPSESTAPVAKDSPPTGPGTTGSGRERGSGPPGSSQSPTGGTRTTIPRPPGANPTAVENLRPGGRGWSRYGHLAGVAGYLARPSVALGEQVRLHASGAGPIDVEWWRLGWYQGMGGRLVRTDHAVAVPPRGSAPRPDPETGLVEAGWPAVLTFEIDHSWPSGSYLAVLRSPAGNGGVAPFIVREGADGRKAPVLFVSASTTWQAYNGWGGKSLYQVNSRGHTAAVANARAVVVSFDRPYDTSLGADFQRRWELPFIRWQEREGRDVGYASDVDLALHPEVLDGRRLVVFAGHHEYWSRTMRDALEARIAAGTNVAFLSANEIYWQVRLEPGPLGPASRIVCYKSAVHDPLTATDPSLATCRWREPPVGEPEARLIGQMYGHVVATPADWVVTNRRHWLYEGTGLVDGDRITNLVGQEYDTLFPDLAPPGTVVVARGPVKVVSSDSERSAYPSPAIHTATVYSAASGATIVAAGTFQWSWALDAYGPRSYAGQRTPVDQRVRRMTTNLFDRLGDGPLGIG